MRARPWLALLAALALTSSVVGLTACGSDDADGTATSESASSAEGGAERPKIAFLNILASNTFATEVLKEAERVASERGADVTEFDGGYDAAKQQQQLQNVISSDQYDGVIIIPVGTQLATDVTSAADAGLKTVAIETVLGDDYNTTEPQVEGLDFAVLTPPQVLGNRLGELALQACEGKDPCRVVYFYGVKGTPSDNAYIKGFKETIAKNLAVEIAAEGEGEYKGPDVALAAMQNILQSTPEFDVVVGVDQAMQGVQLALEQAGKLEGVSIIGLGGSEAAVKGIADGKWFGGVQTVPRTEGEIGMNAMLDLIAGEYDGPSGVDPSTEVPDNGLITQENVDEFEAQWKG
jgi:ribose transport system substrate-binding protein